MCFEKLDARKLNISDLHQNLFSTFESRIEVPLCNSSIIRTVLEVILDLLGVVPLAKVLEVLSL